MTGSIVGTWADLRLHAVLDTDDDDATLDQRLTPTERYGVVLQTVPTKPTLLRPGPAA